jgi:putative ABC transport system permease protein
VRFAFRQVRRSKGLSAMVVATVAIAIGANAAIFGAVRPVVRPDLSFPEPDRIVRIWERNDQRGWLRSSASWQDARDWRDASRTLESLAVYTIWEGNLRTDEAAERIRYALVEPDFFRVMGVVPELGRALLPEEGDPVRDDVVILGHGLWARAYGADPNVIGRRITLSDRDFTVVGVMPSSFRFPAPDVDAWKPFGMTPDEGGTRDSYWVSAIGRLAPGVTLAGAQAEMDAIGRGLEEAHPDTNGGFRPFLEPLADVAVLTARTGVYLLWAAVSLLLLVASVNVAMLLLARGESRTTEMEIRASLGAARGALLRQLLMESLVLAALGGLFGLGLAVPATRGIAALMEGRLAFGLEVELSPSVVIYTVLVTAIIGVAFGLLPALRTSPVDPVVTGGVRGAAARPGARVGAVLVVTQVAMASVILVGAGLLARSFGGLRGVDPGYRPSGALVFRVAPAWELGRDGAQRVLDEIRTRLAVRPEVTGVSAVNRLPLTGSMWGSLWTDRARTEEPPLRAFTRVVLPGYLETLGLPVVEGRGLAATDDEAAEPAVVVSRRAAHIYWPDGDAVGSFVSLSPDDARAHWYRVVGVVDDVEETGIGNGPGSVVYVPFAQAQFGHFGDWGMDFIVRTGASPGALASAVRDVVADVDPALPAFAVQTLEERVAGAISAPRSLALLMAIFGGTALFLTSLGIYGTLAYGVTRRRGEIGVRLALGAGRAEVVGNVVLHGLFLSAAGLGAGLLLAPLGSRWVQALLFGVAPFDPVTYGGIALVLILVAGFASALPAWRAARVDPVEALRGE